MMPRAAATFGVTCIIPVYNEAARLSGVLAAVSDHPLVDEVLVVDDGSTDDSAAIATATPGVTLIRQPRNGGKTMALAAGLAAMRHPYLLMLDGDLLGLTSADVSRLIAPVQDGTADVSISLRGNAPWPWRVIGLDYISGERVLPRSLLPTSPRELERLPKFGFEVHLNAVCIKARTRISVVRWPDVKSPTKETKFGFWTGLRADARMMQDIFRTIPPTRLILQIMAMRNLRTNAHPRS
jgi:Glycosyl transferase family 2